MIWAALAVLALACLAPLVLSLRRQATARGRRDAAIALYTAQLSEIDRDREERRLSAPDHQAARLEVQRRLLQVLEHADAAAPAKGQSGQFPVLAAITLIPAGALVLYLIGGAPGMPAAPHREIAEALRQRADQDGDLIDQLHARLALADPRSEQSRPGFVLLGNAEASRGNLAAAAAAWQVALAAKFEPTLAAETAEAMTRAAGHLTTDAAALFRKALAAAPDDAEWRPLAEKRLLEEGRPGALPLDPAQGKP